jgi:hypothetical protein
MRQARLRDGRATICFRLTTRVRASETLRVLVQSIPEVVSIVVRKA